MKIVQSETVVPHDLEAERCVLGAILVNNDLFFDVADILAPGDFFRVAHREIFYAMHALSSAGTAIDYRTLSGFLRDAGALEDVGGVVYLAGLADGVPHSANAVAYATMVAEYALSARIVANAERVILQANKAPGRGRELLSFFTEQVLSLQESSLKTGDLLTPDQMLTNVMPGMQELQEGTRPPGLSTGWYDLDQKLLGLKPGNLVLIAARPSMGKTAFALNLADKVARKDGLPVAFFSLEMSIEEVGIRLVASIGRLDATSLSTPKGLREDELIVLGQAFGSLGASRLFVTDANVGVFDVRSRARRLQAQHGLALIVIDYLQLMKMPAGENRNNEVAAASRALKLTAKELGVPIVVLSQLNRGSERRNSDERRPQLSDLRDSGALEQDADTVLFIHRPEYYKPNEPELFGRAEIVIAKQRNGPTGVVPLCWLAEYQRFENLA